GVLVGAKRACRESKSRCREPSGTGPARLAGPTRSQLPGPRSSVQAEYPRDGFRLGPGPFLDLPADLRAQAFQTARRQHGDGLLVDALAVDARARQVRRAGAVRQGEHQDRAAEEAVAQGALQDLIVFALDGEPHGIADL